MKFTVVALDSVDADLATLYMQASDPQSITQAANWIDSELKNDPLSKVTPVDYLFFLRRDPLVVLCKISENDRLVTIIEIHRV